MPVAPISARPVWEDLATAAPPFELPPLDADVDVDVTVIGGGLSGLWTAMWLRRFDPALQILVLERDRIGFGASGRNGGWASALLPMSPASLRERLGTEAAARVAGALVENLADLSDELVRLEPTAARGGTIELIRSPVQAARARRRLGEMRMLGLDDPVWLSAHEAHEHVHATRVQGALYSPHCIAVDPRSLVNNLARAVAAAGVAIRRAEVLDWQARSVTTARTRVRSAVIVRATEAYGVEATATRRDYAPIYSMMIATGPLPLDLVTHIGLERRTTFTDGRHLLVYGQRTSDDRLAFGGRGAMYHYGSRLRPSFDHDPVMCRRLHRAMLELFPALSDVDITHHWGGPLAMPRDRFPAVRYDPSSGLASLGGYTGDGVALSYLAGRSAAAMITKTPIEPAVEAWFAASRRRWEPEPLRWLGINTVRTGAALADRLEGHPGVGRLVDRVTGR